MDAPPVSQISPHLLADIATGLGIGFALGCWHFASLALVVRGLLGGSRAIWAAPLKLCRFALLAAALWACLSWNAALLPWLLAGLLLARFAVLRHVMVRQ